MPVLLCIDSNYLGTRTSGLAPGSVLHFSEKLLFQKQDVHRKKLCMFDHILTILCDAICNLSYRGRELNLIVRNLKEPPQQIEIDHYQ